MPMSTIRDGWGILLNAESHLRATSNDVAAIQLIQEVRQNDSNFRSWAQEWANHETRKDGRNLIAERE